MDGGLQALSRSSLGWAPVGEPQDDEVSHARGVAVAMDVQVKASEDEDEDDDEDEDAMLREVVRRHAYGSWRRRGRHRAYHSARTQRVLRDGFVRWVDESEHRILTGRGA